jgi:hypothetical protein
MSYIPESEIDYTGEVKPPSLPAHSLRTPAPPPRKDAGEVVSPNEKLPTGGRKTHEYGDVAVAVIARSSDPETSHTAAAEFEANQTKAQKCVKIAVQILEEKGPLTDFEIRDVWTDYWGSDAWSFTLPCKARHWARQAGLVKHVGFGSHHGRKVRKWGTGCDTEFLDTQHKCPTCGKRSRTPR